MYYGMDDQKTQRVKKKASFLMGQDKTNLQANFRNSPSSRDPTIRPTASRYHRDRRAAYGRHHRPIEVCLSGLFPADDNCRDATMIGGLTSRMFFTDDVITSMTCRSPYRRAFFLFSFLSFFLLFCLNTGISKCKHCSLI